MKQKTKADQTATFGQLQSIYSNKYMIYIILFQTFLTFFMKNYYINNS